MAEHDPGRNPEEEGIPDLQDGTPEQQQASDPQQKPVPGDEPVAVDRWGTTDVEQRAHEPLAEKLDAEEPEDDRPEPPDEETGVLVDDPDSPWPRNQDMFTRGTPQPGMSAEEAAVHTPEDQDRI
ncbi:hypothetical protein AQ490_20290 [Wenjunlia vitaminophila]|uniref:DUF5709 domain-containing protein n=1 Tax=Wenjunlia vitaminophila TaxID=76728 RepID=A0A0T6LVF5_WENVI|nr:hypothetical protein [Wenjunlia vitaminophila]KRV49692.1 hypothetical protein AQ490_20290 [Wenjunlia vitaminophila]